MIVDKYLTTLYSNILPVSLLFYQLLNCDHNSPYSQDKNHIGLISPTSNISQTTDGLPDLEPFDFDNATETINNMMETDLENCKETEIKDCHEICKLGHDMRECDPSYDGHHAMTYYDDLWGGLTCIKADCPNAGRSFGEMIKMKIKVHYCKLCENYEGYNRCNHVICDLCKTKDEESMSGNRRSRRMRN